MTDSTHSRLVRVRLTVVCLTCLVLFIGCGSPYRPVNVGTAQETLLLMLDSWKEGKKPADLVDETPPITVEERDWNAGFKLLDYEIISDDTAVDSNLVAWVKLKLSSTDGKPAEQTAKYIVSTSPELSIFRIMMR